MNSLLLITKDTIRALLYQRLLVALMLVILALTVVFSVLLTETKEQMLEIAGTPSLETANGLDEEELRQARERMASAGALLLALFYWFTALGGTIVTLYICCSAVSSDLRRGTIQIVLAKSVSRTQFLMGKYFGAVGVMFAYSILSGAALVVFTYSNQLDLNLAALYAPWLMFCQNLMVGSVALLLSLLVHPLIAAVIAFFAGAHFFSSPNPLYFVLPSYDRFDVFSHIFQGRLIALEDILVLTAYAFDITAIFLLLAIWRFRYKELL